MRRLFARLLCHWLGHKPQTFVLHEEGRRQSITSCSRCSVSLDFDEREGRYPLSRPRVEVRR